MKRSPNDNLRKLLRKELKTLRISKNITQKELAKKLKTNQSYISKYESGERCLDLIEVYEICKKLNYNFLDFVKKFFNN